MKKILYINKIVIQDHKITLNELYIISLKYIIIY